MAASVIHQSGSGEANLFVKSLDDHEMETARDSDDFEEDDQFDDEMLLDDDTNYVHPVMGDKEEEEQGDDDDEDEDEEDEEGTQPRQLLRFAETVSSDIQRLFGRRGAEGEGHSTGWSGSPGTYRDRFASGKSGRELYYADLLRLAEGGDSWWRCSSASTSSHSPGAVGNASRRISSTTAGAARGRDEERPLGPLSELFSGSARPFAAGARLWSAHPAAVPMLKRRLPPSFFTEPTTVTPACGGATRAHAAAAGALGNAADAAAASAAATGGLLNIEGGDCNLGHSSTGYCGADGGGGDVGSAGAGLAGTSSAARGLGGGGGGGTGIISTCTPDFSDLLATWANEEEEAECSGEEEGSSLEAGPTLGHATPAAHLAVSCQAATFIMSHG
ncbi:protein PERCC1 isoform X2 [Lethenteron reissneri]|nr:protein PERCC1 isoform X2 [Lethenteron reissneri]